MLHFTNMHKSSIFIHMDFDVTLPFLSGLIDSGLLGRIRVVVFKNELKEKNEQPAYHILLSDPPEKQLEDVPF